MFTFGWIFYRENDMALIRTKNFAINGDDISGVLKDEHGGLVVLTYQYPIEIDADCAAEILAAIGQPPAEEPQT